MLAKYPLRWENNIKINVREVRCGVLSWLDVADNRQRSEPLQMPCMYGLYNLEVLECFITDGCTLRRAALCFCSLLLKGVAHRRHSIEHFTRQ